MFMIPIQNSPLPPPEPVVFDHVDNLEHIITNGRVWQCWGRLRIRMRSPLLEQEDPSRANETFGEF